MQLNRLADFNSLVKEVELESELQEMARFQDLPAAEELE